jgi:hypothetical protein
MNEINQFCVRWSSPDSRSVITAAIAVLDDGTCEVVGVDTGSEYVMRKIAVRAANCEDGNIKVNGRTVLPENYCTKWRSVLKKPLAPDDLAGKYVIVCNIVRGEGYLGYLEDLAMTFGCEMPKTKGEFIRLDMLAPEIQSLMFQNYGTQSAINSSGQWTAWKMKQVEHDLFSMREAA